MSEAKNHLGTINLEAEIEIRRRLSETFDRVVEVFTHISGEDRNEINAAALLLLEVREQLSKLRKQEEALKAELRRFFPIGSEILDLPSALVLIQPSSRTDLDKPRLLTEYGQSFIEVYSKTTEFEKLSVKRK